MTESIVGIEGQEQREVGVPGEVEARHQAVEWKDDRLVAKRPEIRNSVLEKSYILRTEEQKQGLDRMMGQTVLRRRAMTSAEKKAELLEMAKLAGEEV